MALAETSIAEPSLVCNDAPTRASAPMMPRRRGSVCCHELDGEAVLYDLAHHAMHYLNSTALVVYNLCDGGRTIENIGIVMAVLHDLDFQDPEVRAQVLADVRQTVAGLVENGLVEVHHEGRVV